MVRWISDRTAITRRTSWAGEVRNVSLLVAIGVTSEGFREMLGICEGAKGEADKKSHCDFPPNKSGWSGFLRYLVDRGLSGVELIVSDACRGLIESVAEYLPDARWQRCIVHFYRNVFSHVPATKVREVAHMLKAINAQESREAATEKAEAVIAELRRQRMGKAADLLEERIQETLTFYAFPDRRAGVRHWSEDNGEWIKLRTNNPLERLMKEIRRRTKVVGAFPDGKSCLNLAAARLRHVAGTEWSTRRYMNMQPLHEMKLQPNGVDMYNSARHLL